MNIKTLHRFITVLLLCCTVMPVMADKKPEERRVKLSEPYVYRSDNKAESLVEAEAKAKNQAKFEALKMFFGERIYNESHVSMTNDNGRSTIHFVSEGGSEMSAEWIETIEEKIVKEDIVDGFFVISVLVEGRAREVVDAKADLEALVLRNGTEAKFQSEQFKSNDDLYVSFLSPADGYVAIYIVDDENAYCLIPYKEMTQGVYQVKGGQRYIFFSEKDAQTSEKSYELPVCVYTEKNIEINEVVIIYSPNYFTKAIDSEEQTKEVKGISGELITPRQLNRDKFLSWLAKARRKDLQMQQVRKSIKITK